MILEQNRQDVVDFLQKDPERYFENIGIVAKEPGSIESAAQASLNEKGVIITVEMPSGKVLFPGVGAGAMDFNLLFTVIENVEMNRSEVGTKKSAEDVMENLYRRFHPMQAGTALPCVLGDFNVVTNTKPGITAIQIPATSKGGWTPK